MDVVDASLSIRYLLPLTGGRPNQMINIDDYDLSELRAKWARRRVGVEQVKARADVRGMTRPARDPDEAAFLKKIGKEGPFTEVDVPGWREWMERRYRRPDLPGLEDGATEQ